MKLTLLSCVAFILVYAETKTLTGGKWSYVGCYNDKRPRDLTSYHKDASQSSAMTMERCYKFCSRMNTLYMALQDGNTCRCDNGYGRYGKASESKCDEECGGDDSQTCGGNFRNSIYQIRANGAATMIDSTMMQLSTSTSLSFTALGDWGKEGSHQRQVAKTLATWSEDNKSRFTMALGDNFYEYGVSSATNSKWKTTWKDVYNYPSLSHPWLAIEGNHDYLLGNYPYQVEYGKSDSRWVMPSLYYSMHFTVAGQDVHFVFLDTEPVKNDNSDYHQVKWFQNEIANSKADWLIVVGHHPIYSSGSHGSGSSTKVLYNELRPYMEKHGVAFYICGHDHFLEHLNDGSKVEYVLSGAGAKLRSKSSRGTDNLKSKGVTSKFFQSEYGFVGFNIVKDMARVVYIDEDGKKVYQFTKTNPRKDNSAFG